MPILTPVQELAEAPFNGIPHRGGNYPVENTPDAFRHALGLEFKWLETDVFETRESGLLAFHGPTLAIVGEPDKHIVDVNPDDLARYRERGVHIPRFQELLRIIHTEAGNKLVWNIDAKNREAVDPLLEIIKEERMEDHVVFCAFDKDTASDLRRRTPDRTATALTEKESFDLVTGALTKRPKDVTFAQLPVVYLLEDGDTRMEVPVLSEATNVIADARRLGMDVHAWAEDKISTDPVDTREGLHELARLGCKGAFVNDLKTARDAIDALPLAS